jgi:translation initiation factor IF-2
MPVRTATPPAAAPVTDVVGVALEVFAAQGLTRPAAHAALVAMAKERGLTVARCAALVVAAVDGRMS